MEESKIKIKISFYGELIDHTINSDYKCFLKDICNLFNLSESQLNSISLNYKDEEDDIIILSNENDFELFLEQVKNKVVDTLIIEIKEDTNIGEEKEKEKRKESNNINHNNKNNINDQNNNDIFHDNFNKSENYNQNINNDAPLILNFECKSCYISPIINSMYYCKKCNFCYCEECRIKYNKHPHPFEKIETEEQFEKFKKEYNEKIKLKQNSNNNSNININNDNNFNRNNNNYNNNNNIVNNNNNNIDNNRINIRNQNQNYNNINHNNINNINQNNNNQYIDIYNNNNNYQYNNDFNNNNIFNQSVGLPIQIPFLINQIGNSLIQLKSDIENIHLFRNMKYFQKIYEMRRKYNLSNISDDKLYEALNRANGNIEEALGFLCEN